MQLQCTCGIVMTAAPGQEGQMMQCPSCGLQFRVPGKQSPTLNRSSNPILDTPTFSTPASSPSYVGTQRSTQSSSTNTILLSSILGLLALIAIIFGTRLVVDLASKMASSSVIETAEASGDANIEPAGSIGSLVSETPSELYTDPFGSDDITITSDASYGSTTEISDPVMEELPDTPAMSNSMTMEAPETTPSSSGRLSMADLIEIVEPCVVRLDVKSSQGESIGSGFAIAPGTIVTNYHVIEGAIHVKLTNNSGQTTNATGYTLAIPDVDIAIVKYNTASLDLDYIELAATIPRKGEDVAAFGAPRGFSFSATQGIVSAVRTGDEIMSVIGKTAYEVALGYTAEAEWVQTSAAISGGNSGGPLVNMMGDVVAMNTFTNATAQNLNFAISMNVIREKLNEESPTVKPLSSLPKKMDVKKLSSAILDTLFGTSTVEEAAGEHFEVSSIAAVAREFRHGKKVVDVATSSDGSYIATTGLDGDTYVFNAKTGKATFRLHSTEKLVVGVGFVSNPTRCVTFRSGGVEASVAFRDCETGEILDKVVNPTI